LIALKFGEYPGNGSAARTQQRLIENFRTVGDGQQNGVDLGSNPSSSAR